MYITLFPIRNIVGLQIRQTLYHAFHDTEDPMNIIWQLRKTLLHSFRDTDDPTNIYGNSGKLCHILSVMMMIQRTYMI